MKAIFFDSSTLISLASACALRPFRLLQKDYGADFVITSSVKAECIDKAISILRFKYEGLRLKRLLGLGTFREYKEKNFILKINELLSLINSTYFAFSHPITLVHLGEISALCLALAKEADAIAIDERTTRLVIENPELLQDLLQSKLHTKVEVNKGNLKLIKKRIQGKLTVLRSTEFALAAFEKGYLDKRTPEILEGILWALKFAGCAISRDEIRMYVERVV